MTRILGTAVVIGMVLGLAQSGVCAPIKVSGKLTFDDGTLIQVPAGARIALSFELVDPSVPKGKPFPRPGAAEIDLTNGTFDCVTSHLYGDGLEPGKYKVRIEALDKNQQRLSVVPAEYGDFAKTPIKVEINANTKPLEIKINKPGAQEKLNPSDRAAETKQPVMVKVSGKLTYDDGTLIQIPADGFVILMFHRIEKGEPAHANKKLFPGGADINLKDGTFDSVTTHMYADGLLPGKYKVCVRARSKEMAILPVVLPEYGDPKTTPLEIEVSASTKPLEIKIKKPAAAPAK